MRSHLVGLTVLLLPSILSAQTREGFFQRPHDFQIYYRVEGTGPDTLVYLHGGPGGRLSDEAILDNAPLFGKHTVIFYQQRGNGRSSPATEDSLTSAAQHVEDLEAIRLAFHLEQLTLYGVSWGGGLAALYAATYPDRVRRVLQVNPMPPRRAPLTGTAISGARLDSTEQELFQQAAHTYGAAPDSASCLAFARLNAKIYTAPGPNRDSLIARACRDPHPPTPEERQERGRSMVVYRWTLQSLGDWDLRGQLGRVTAPALIIHGEADFLPLESVRAYARAYPSGRYLVLPGAGHSLPGDNPVAFFAIVEQFLAGTWPEHSQTDVP
jgi:proline iminopeptidase